MGLITDLKKKREFKKPRITHASIENEAEGTLSVDIIFHGKRYSGIIPKHRRN